MDETLQNQTMKKSFGKSLLYTLPMFLLTFILLTGGRPDFSDRSGTIALLTTFLGLNTLYFLMHFTGKTDKLRAILFIVFALTLSFTLIKNMVDIRQTMTYSRATFLNVTCLSVTWSFPC
jgi:hypothetical protein